MNNEIIFYTQIIMFISFAGSLFVLYRVLVKQKDAVIELLKERYSFLEEKLREAQNQSPDLLVERISKRMEFLNQELELLHQDQNKNHELVSKKESELKEKQEELSELKTKIERADELLEGYLCPQCKEEPMVTRDFGWESVEINGREMDIDHEYILYACGLELVDGVEKTKCGSL